MISARSKNGEDLTEAKRFAQTACRLAMFLSALQGCIRASQLSRGRSDRTHEDHFRKTDRPNSRLW
jgi:hypothetical protein